MCCARDSNVSSFEDLSKALFVEHFTRLIEDLSFFFEIKQRLKCKTYSIDKEETSIIILKSFSYKVISTDMLVYIYNNYNIIIKTNMPVQFITLYVLYT